MPYAFLSLSSFSLWPDVFYLHQNKYWHQEISWAQEVLELFTGSNFWLVGKQTHGGTACVKTKFEKHSCTGTQRLYREISFKMCAQRVQTTKVMESMG